MRNVIKDAVWWHFNVQYHGIIWFSFEGFFIIQILWIWLLSEERWCLHNPSRNELDFHLKKESVFTIQVRGNLIFIWRTKNSSKYKYMWILFSFEGWRLHYNLSTCDSYIHSKNEGFFIVQVRVNQIFVKKTKYPSQSNYVWIRFSVEERICLRNPNMRDYRKVNIFCLPISSRRGLTNLWNSLLSFLFSFNYFVCVECETQVTSWNLILA